MYYYYDVLLNWSEGSELYEFYEWEENDNIEFIKKIPVFRISTTTLKDQIRYITKFDSHILEMINKKTVSKSGKVMNNIFLISDVQNALALEIDDEGLVISRSKLLLNDEMHLLEIMYTLKETKLKYEKVKKIEPRKDIRQLEKIKKLIKCEINTLFKANNFSKLKYLYYEWFNKNNNDLNKIKKQMEKSLENESFEKLKKIGDLIKISYHKTN